MNTPTRERISELDAMLINQDELIQTIVIPGEGVNYDILAENISALLENEYPEGVVDKEGTKAPCGLVTYSILAKTGTTEVTREGRFSVRFAKQLKIIYGKKASDNLKSRLGDIYNAAKEPERKFHYDITNDFSWNDGDFGKRGSCWWGVGGDSYSSSRDALYTSGGFGLRIYDDEGQYGIGRVWLYPLDGRVYLFNAYGIDIKDAARIILRILADYTGETCKYRRCSIDSPSWFYVNNGGGYVVYTDEDNREDFSVDLDNTLIHQDDIFDREDEYSCAHCEDGINEDEIYCVNDEVFCYSCYEDLFSVCEYCNDAILTDEIHHVYGHRQYTYLCEDCIGVAGFALCEVCEEYHYDTNTTGDTCKTMCNECIENNAIFCEACDEYFEHYHEDEEQ